MLYGDCPDFLQKKFTELNKKGVSVSLTRHGGTGKKVLTEAFIEAKAVHKGFGFDFFDAFAMAYESYIKHETLEVA